MRSVRPRCRLCTIRLCSQRAFVDHFLAANNTSAVAHGVELLDRRVRVPFVHVTRCGAVAHKVTHPAVERARGHEDIANDVEGQAVIGQHCDEEYEIGDKLEEICAKGQDIRRVSSGVHDGSYQSTGRRRTCTCSCPPTVARCRHPCERRVGYHSTQ